jgi:hypothetical protein
MPAIKQCWICALLFKFTLKTCSDEGLKQRVSLLMTATFAEILKLVTTQAQINKVFSLKNLKSQYYAIQFHFHYSISTFNICKKQTLRQIHGPWH